ncbi:PAC2 family protein [Nanchangia anserum]|uniref:PAC2 family protein n=1 Tax=Nanchangia anserum TaxID=2692125 RepID=A0A8I0GDQ2_9ACTO|nr:PAC2 family protein [Nanchangia anserum]MBD3690250.1 PAC2 family protein [Nanchangia anserum]QOX82308.1 PAC2 family protein [Nanchangia anserum]
MDQPTSALYELGPGGQARAPFLLHYLHGALDSGDAGRLAVRQILSSMPCRRVATFSPDALIDYRARRPIIEMTNWVISQTQDPYIALDVVEDYMGRTMFVLHGSEPDVRWQEFAATLADVLRSHGVTMTASLMGFAATLPHTRATFVHRTGSSPELIPDQPAQTGQVTMRASMDLYLQSYLGRVGFDSVGLVVGVPYYLSEMEYPSAAVALLEKVSDMTELSLPLGDLEAYAASMRTRVDAAMDETSEIAAIVSQLERDYDNEIWHPSGDVEQGMPLPTGEALAQSLEDFLEHNDRQRARRFEADAPARRSLRERLRKRGRHAAAKDPSTTEHDPSAPGPQGRHRRVSED